MPRYRYTGPASVTINVAGGAETLRRFAEEAGSGSGAVPLVSTTTCEIVLLLDERAITEPHNWQGPTFAAGSEVLLVTVEADTPEDCSSLLAAALRSRSDRDQERFAVVVDPEDGEDPGHWRAVW
jgi:hypothetical protein